MLNPPNHRILSRREYLRLFGTTAGSSLLMSSGVDSFIGETCKANNIVLPEQPIEKWPKLQKMLLNKADKRAVKLKLSSSVTLEASEAILAPDTNNLEVLAVDSSSVRIPSEGLITFAIDAEEAMYVTGSLSLAADKDLTPGLRAYIMSDTTLIAAPMVSAKPWKDEGNGGIGATPRIKGNVPSSEIQLTRWRLEKGRHYITIAGPHFRSGGKFRHLDIKVLEKKPDVPLYQFALTPDTHIGHGRAAFRNRIMMGPVDAELTDTFTQLKKQDVAFTLLAGDMTDQSRTEQFQRLADIFKKTGLPGYGCVGNHDAYLSPSRKDMLELLPELFPGGKTYYTFQKGPLRFITLDASYWITADGEFLDYYDRNQPLGLGMKPDQKEWFKSILAADTITPTIVMSHYPFYSAGGSSSSGHRTETYQAGQGILDLVKKAPNVIATFNGHTHRNEFAIYEGVACIQNPPFAEWPNAYRVFRVYPNRVEWELRQVNNRGFIRESFVPEKAVTWPISARPDDLAGQITFKSPRKQGNKLPPSVRR